MSDRPGTLGSSDSPMTPRDGTTGFPWSTGSQDQVMTYNTDTSSAQSPICATSPASSRTVITSWLQTPSDAWPSFEPARLVSSTGHPLERHARSAALACPDLFLIAATKGSDRLDFAFDLGRDILHTSQRAVFITRNAPDADRLVARLRNVSPAITRAVGHHERAEHFSPAVLACCSHDLRMQSNRRQMESLEREQELLNSRRRTLNEQLGRLTQLSQKSISLEETRKEIHSLQSQLNNHLHAIDSSLSINDELHALSNDHAREVSEITGQLAEVRSRLEEQRANLSRLMSAPVTAGSTKPTGMFGRLKGLFSRPASVSHSDPSTANLVKEVEHLEQLAAHLTAQLAGTEQNFLTRRDQLLTKAHNARSAMEARLQLLEDDLRSQSNDFEDILADTDLPDFDSLSDRQTEFEQRIHIYNQEIDDIAQRLSGLDTQLDEFGLQLASCANEALNLPQIVVGSIEAIGSDSLLSVPDTPAYDYVVMLAAEELNEDELDLAARLGQASILLGELPGFHRAKSHGGHAPTRPHLSYRISPRFPVFRTLWQHFQTPSFCEATEGRRLVRLEAIPYEVVDVEPLADRPEIELHFGKTLEESRALLAVSFPEEMSASQIKQFLADELGLIQLSPLGARQWDETEGEITVTWPTALLENEPRHMIQLGNGIAESMQGENLEGSTVAVTFSRDAGWDLSSAREWLSNHLRCDRTAILPRPLVLTDTPSPVTSEVAS